MSISERRKKKEAAIGLANNASGAAFGVIGTKAVYDQQRELSAARKLRDAGKPQPPRVAPKVTRLERGLRKIKVKPKFVLPALGAVAVGGQVANAGMDAQSAHYFGRELNDMRKKNMAKSDAQSAFDVYVAKADRTSGIGRSMVEVKVSKKIRRFDPEGDRQRRLGIYEGAGGAGAGVLAAGAVREGVRYQQGLKRTGKKVGDLTLKELKAKKLIPAGVMAAGGLASAGVAVAAHRRANSARNERWT